MKTMLISDFKARCIAALREAQDTGEPLVITRRGQPIARIEPLPATPGERPLGALQGRMKLHTDLVRATSEDEWEMLD